MSPRRDPWRMVGWERSCTLPLGSSCHNAAAGGSEKVSQVHPKLIKKPWGTGHQHEGGRVAKGQDWDSRRSNRQDTSSINPCSQLGRDSSSAVDARGAGDASPLLGGTEGAPGWV